MRGFVLTVLAIVSWPFDALENRLDPVPLMEVGEEFGAFGMTFRRVR